MNISLQVNNLAKAYSQPLFDGVSLHVSGPGKIALIGDNGSGKSTVLKILAGLESPDAGTVQWADGLNVGYLEQEIIEDLSLSGGEKKILKISQLFYGGYEILLLDEPDNHLDRDHKFWFEQLVKDFPGLAIIISHDRTFLKNATDKIWLLEEQQISQYPFGYEKFREIYEGESSARQHLWEVQEKERKRLEVMVEEYRERASHNSKLAKSYHGMVKRYERFVRSMAKKPPAEKFLGLESNLAKQSKRKTAVFLKNISKSFGKKKVLGNLNLHVFCGEKIAIAAPNGAGKSTLLNIITGRLKADSGELYLGPKLKIGNYTQDHLASLDPDENLIKELQKSSSFAYYDAIAYLKRFFFTEGQCRMAVRFLSGGQKSRLQLAKFLSTNPDVLILDEPTNHLDLKTVISLENFLRDYQGTLILVSHDQELVNNVVEKVYLLDNEGLGQPPLSAV